jgi:hypothetical protein
VNRLNEAVGSALSGGTRSPPGPSEGMAIARVVASELDSAKFDPLLVRSVAKGAVGALELFGSKMDGLVRPFLLPGRVHNELADDWVVREGSVGYEFERARSDASTGFERAACELSLSLLFATSKVGGRVS